MNKNLELITSNLTFIRKRVDKENTAKQLWISEAIKEITADRTSDLSEIGKRLKSISETSVTDMLTAAHMLTPEDISELHQDFSIEELANKPLTVSNFSSPLSDQTFSRFFGEDKADITARDNFIELFEDVYNDSSAYCIVPIENTTSGKLMNFYSLIANYNLKILSVCDVEHLSQDASTRFALLSSGPIHPHLRGKNTQFFEISISASENGKISRLMLAAELCGIHSKRIDSMPYTHLANEYLYYIVFKLDEDAYLAKFLTFLALEGISYTPIGIFTSADE